MQSSSKCLDSAQSEFGPLRQIYQKIKEKLFAVLPIEIDTLEYQQTEKIETELEDVDRIRIRKMYACCPGLHSGGS